jgi:hypothetical protein
MGWSFEKPPILTTFVIQLCKDLDEDVYGTNSFGKSVAPFQTMQLLPEHLKTYSALSTPRAPKNEVLKLLK